MRAATLLISKLLIISTMMKKRKRSRLPLYFTLALTRECITARRKKRNLNAPFDESSTAPPYFIAIAFGARARGFLTKPAREGIAYRAAAAAAAAQPLSSRACFSSTLLFNASRIAFLYAHPLDSPACCSPTSAPTHRRVQLFGIEHLFRGELSGCNFELMMFGIKNLS